MTDDREIDALIAEKVFGWVIKKRTRMYAGTPGCFDLIKPNTDRVETAGTLVSLLEIYIPKYTTNASDFNALLDRLAETYDYLLGSGKTRPDEPQFGFALFKKGATRGSANPKPLFMAEADTKFRAAALCALKAVGVEL